MEGDNFVLPGTKRVPSLFAAGCFYFLAVAGKPLIELFELGLLRLYKNVGGVAPDGALFGAILTIAYYFCFCLLPLLFYARRHPGIGEYMRIKPAGLSAALAGVGAGVAGFFLCIHANTLWILLIEALGGTVPDSGSLQMENAGDVVRYLLLTAILPALCEELLFRGAILSAWEEKGSRKAILITALLFTLLHSRFAGMPAELISGLILGFLVVITGSLMTGIIYHTVHNSMAIWLTLLTAGQEETGGSAFEAIGGAAGLILVLVRIAVYAAALFLLFRFLKLRYGTKALERPAVPGEEKGVCEWTVWFCGALLALALYSTDILTVIGVLQ